MWSQYTERLARQELLCRSLQPTLGVTHCFVSEALECIVRGSSEGQHSESDTLILQAGRQTSFERHVSLERLGSDHCAGSM